MSRLLPLTPATVSVFALLAPTLLAQGQPAVGLDVTIDGVAGLAPSEIRNTSLQGIALAHATWSAPTEKPDDTPAWELYLSALGLAGKGPTEKFVGDLNALSNIEADKGARLYSWYGKLQRDGVSVKAGALLADEDFATTEAGGGLINSGFGWPAFISGNTVNTGPAYFVPALGVHVQAELQGGLTLQAGFYDGDSFDSEEGDSKVNEHGWRYRLEGDQSSILFAEAGWQATEFPLLAKLGYWRHGADFMDTYADENGDAWAVSGLTPRSHSGNHGFYGILGTFREKPLGLDGRWDLHLRYGTSPDDRNAVSSALDVAWAWTGLAGRENDSLALGYLRSSLGSPFRQTWRELDPSFTPAAAEEVVELSYRWQIDGHWAVQPDFQWIQHPGGDAGRAAAKVVTVRLMASF